MKTRLITAAAALAVAGGALAAAPALTASHKTAGAAPVAASAPAAAPAPAPAPAVAAKVQKFDFRRGWGTAYGTKSTKVVQGRMSDQRNDEWCIQTRIAWSVKRGSAFRVFDRDSKTVCGALVVAFRATPDYKGRPYKASRVTVGFFRVRDPDF
ncbi:hypothetical protein J4573_25395 [Actinomadura barringtoniae]|uniref:RlpA-like protein double-psi beta-barrel domain-containing protein n=1 Tax=Actinomadura barringtoniae TaxID=1427535 RepID=A0A939PDR6_9ACTN|nr:hypothetical protein [Actinomadura barringtoniae]MBO2450463.1 hypothetical protein [Actinomadura barringtoniae]